MTDYQNTLSASRPSASATPAAHFATHFTYVGALVPQVYKAAARDPDTLSYDEAIADHEHIADWKAAATKEIRCLEEKGTWKEVPMSDAKTKILPGTWVFRRKRTPDGTIKKYKARYCVRGDLQEGDQDTFAPVVAFSTVRTFLALSLAFGWPAISIDFDQAFIQAPMTEPVWIHPPRGFHARTRHGERTCLKLLRSLYGLRAAPLMFFEYCHAAFVELGFTSCSQDRCLLLRHNCFVVLYVDDAGISAPNEAIIDALIRDLEGLGMQLTREGSFVEFLGIKFTPKTNGAIELTQKGLVKKILSAMDMADCSVNKTPTTQLALGSDPDGPAMTETWSYPSIVGMLLYLSTNTRPDIAYAVSQVARFGSNPKQSHAVAVKMIARYLKGTHDKGMIVRPDTALGLEAFVDADFAGLYQREPDHVLDAARSHRIRHLVGRLPHPLEIPIADRNRSQHRRGRVLCTVPVHARGHSPPSSYFGDPHGASAPSLLSNKVQV